MSWGTPPVPDVAAGIVISVFSMAFEGPADQSETWTSLCPITHGEDASRLEPRTQQLDLHDDASRCTYAGLSWPALAS